VWHRWHRSLLPEGRPPTRSALRRKNTASTSLTSRTGSTSWSRLRLRLSASNTLHSCTGWCIVYVVDTSVALDAWEEISRARRRRGAPRPRGRARSTSRAASRLRSCAALAEHGHDGTELAGCAKVCLPPSAGRFGMVFVLRLDSDARPLLTYVAFGVRHHPPHARSPTVYQLAHQRMHSRPPHAERREQSVSRNMSRTRRKCPGRGSPNLPETPAKWRNLPSSGSLLSPRLLVRFQHGPSERTTRTPKGGWLGRWAFVRSGRGFRCTSRTRRNYAPDTHCSTWPPCG